VKNDKKKIEISLSHYFAHGRAFPNMTKIPTNNYQPNHSRKLEDYWRAWLLMGLQTKFPWTIINPIVQRNWGTTRGLSY
jgi:hypothetical protein